MTPSKLPTSVTGPEHSAAQKASRAVVGYLNRIEKYS